MDVFYWDRVAFSVNTSFYLLHVLGKWVKQGILWSQEVPFWYRFICSHHVHCSYPKWGWEPGPDFRSPSSWNVPCKVHALGRRAAQRHFQPVYSVFWVTMGFVIWFPSFAYQFAVYQCCTRALFILTLTGDPDSQTSVIFVPYLFVHVFRHLVDIYRSPVLLSLEYLSGRAWHLFPLCVCGA